MSGIMMIRGESCVVLLSDGGLFQGVDDFTVTGFVSKPIRLPHLSAIIGYVGTASLSYFMDHNQQPRWSSFDCLLETFRDGVLEEIYSVYANEPGRERLDAMFFIGGYSEKRERWENYRLMATCGIDPEEPKVGEVEPGHSIDCQPGPDEESLRALGMIADDGNVMGDIFTDQNQIGLMRAMRASPQRMGIADGNEPPPTGHTIGGFVERNIVFRDQIITEILWRWPDKPGEMIDPGAEGRPTHLFGLRDGS